MVEKKKLKEELKLKDGMKSLAQELKERIFKTESFQEFDKKESKSDLSDKEIQELSEKITEKDIEEEKKNVDGKKETLISLEDYIKCAVHLGTKVITPHMRKFVYKRRADGLAVINTAMIDDMLREAIKFLNQYEPSHVYLLCKREAGWPAAQVFEKTTGIKVFTKKYTPGATTNLILDNFFEAEMTIICDPWIDKNALADTVRLKKPVLALCDTNNFTSGVSKIIPCNNKSRKSIGCILFILAREYCKHKKIPFTAKITDFSGELE
ncbi:30S ribosomal protein S2 [Candidatus Pacearchaeota archaeon]|nr:30S ribosomal protein S2 [Candidatus Pacearchaeota archaeon]